MPLAQGSCAQKEFQICHLRSRFMLLAESAKLRALRAHVPTCFVCLRANVPRMLTCSRANMPCVLTCLACLRAHVLCMPTCSRDITKISFQ